MNIDTSKAVVVNVHDRGDDFGHILTTWIVQTGPAWQPDEIENNIQAYFEEKFSQFPNGDWIGEDIAEWMDEVLKLYGWTGDAIQSIDVEA